MQPLIILHGAIGASGQLDALAAQLGQRYKVHTLNFTGHGGKAFSKAPFSIELFAADVLAYMDGEGINSATIFGYSMGGYVGMYLAKHYPERVSRIITLATKYQWDETIAAKEIQMLNPDKIQQKLPAFAATLHQRHAPNDWKEVLMRTAEMMIALGNNNTLKLTDYATIGTPALLLLGDRDKMVGLDETLAVYKALPNAQMAMLPGTQHPIEQADAELLAFITSPPALPRGEGGVA